MFSGWKTYLAAAGFFALALHALLEENFEKAGTYFLAGLAAAGIRHSISVENKEVKKKIDRKS